MKKIISIGLVAFMLLFLAGCNRSNLQEQNDIVSPPFTIINTTYNGHKQLIQKILYNEATNKTYIFDYFHRYENGIWICVETELTVLDSEGNITTEEGIENN